MDEQMLRRALMEANLERFRDVLEGAERDCLPDDDRFAVG